MDKLKKYINIILSIFCILSSIVLFFLSLITLYLKLFIFSLIILTFGVDHLYKYLEIEDSYWIK